MGTDAIAARNVFEAASNSVTGAALSASTLKTVMNDSG
jgi:hypothetical protein